MRKSSALLVVALLVACAFAAPYAMAKGKMAKAAGGGKESRWHGIVVRTDKDAMTLDVRKGGVEKRVHYDASTKWTKGKETIDASGVKENDDVICLGTYNDKKEFVATRVDLRPPK